MPVRFPWFQSCALACEEELSVKRNWTPSESLWIRRPQLIFYRLLVAKLQPGTWVIALLIFLFGSDVCGFLYQLICSKFLVLVCKLENEEHLFLFRFQSHVLNHARMHLVGCVVVLGMRATSRAGIGNVISKLQRVSFILWVWDMRILRTEKEGNTKMYICSRPPVKELKDTTS